VNVANNDPDVAGRFFGKNAGATLAGKLRNYLHMYGSTTDHDWMKT
jgi:hypothetical protein